MEEKKKLLAEWLKLKSAEDKAKKKRYELEKEIVKFYIADVSTSKTFNEDDFKVVVKRNFVLSLDQKAYEEVRKEIPENLRPEKIKYELSKEGFTWLKENNLEVYKKVSSCVTEKENKVSIDIEKI